MPAPMGGPPLPPSVAPGAGGTPPGAGGMPSMMQLAGMSGASGTPNNTTGMSQISETTVRMGAEIDQALKLLAQALPQLAPWVDKTVMELRQQIGMALQSGVPTNPEPQDNQSFVDGSGRL